MRSAYAWIGVLGIGVVAGCGSHSDPAATENAAEPEAVVQLGAVETRVFQDAVTSPGQWRSSGEVLIVAPSAAVVESVRPRVGDHVRAGETVIWLVTRESRAALEGAMLLEQQARDAASRAEARRAIALAERDLVRVPLKAPRNAVVLRRTVEPGSQVADQGEVMALVEPSSIVFEAHVAPLDAVRVHSGARATVTEEGHPPIGASVKRVMPTASPTDQAILTWLGPDNPSAAPPLERFGTANIMVGSPRKALAVPDSAVVEDDLTGEKRVARVVHGRAIWTPVVLGTSASGWRELKTRSLSPGDSVVVAGQRGLPDSTRVKVAS